MFTGIRDLFNIEIQVGDRTSHAANLICAKWSKEVSISQQGGAMFECGSPTRGRYVSIATAFRQGKVNFGQMVLCEVQIYTTD